MHWNSYKVQDWHRNERFLRRNPSFAAYLLRSQCSKSLGHLYLQTRFLCDLLKATILTVFPTCYPSSPCAPSGLPSQTVSLLKDWPAYGLSFQRHILISDLQKIIIQRMKLICFPSKRTLFPEIKGQIGCPDYVCSGYVPATMGHLSAGAEVLPHCSSSKAQLLKAAGLLRPWQGHQRAVGQDGCGRVPCTELLITASRTLCTVTCQYFVPRLEVVGTCRSSLLGAFCKKSEW